MSASKECVILTLELDLGANVVDALEPVDVFISHASEDKEAVARPLATAIEEQGFKVWLDERRLVGGDTIRREIDKVLATCRFGIAIISPISVEKKWPQVELDGLFGREMSEDSKIIIPILHMMTYEQLVKRSPILGSRLSYSTSQGISNVANQIVDVLRREPRPLQTFDIRQDLSIEWARVSNLFWLCHDLIELHRWLLMGISKQWLDIGFEQSSWHLEELEFNQEVTDAVIRLRDEAKELIADDWTIARREYYAGEVRKIFNVVAQVVQKYQEDTIGFRSKPSE